MINYNFNISVLIVEYDVGNNNTIIENYYYKPTRTHYRLDV